MNSGPVIGGCTVCLKSRIRVNIFPSYGERVMNLKFSLIIEHI